MENSTYSVLQLTLEVISSQYILLVILSNPLEPELSNSSNGIERKYPSN